MYSCNGCVATEYGRPDMEGVKINQVRWPVELYEWIRERAHERRQSVNKTVIELVERAREAQA